MARSGPKPRSQAPQNPYVLPSLRLQDKVTDLSKVGNGQDISLTQISEAITIQDAIDTLKSLDLAELYAKRFTKEAVDMMVNIMRDDNIKSDTRLRASMAILSRGWGAPAIAIRASSDTMDKDRRKNIEKEMLDAQNAAVTLMEKVKIGFSMPIDGFTQEGDGADFIDEEN